MRRWSISNASLSPVFQPVDLVRSRVRATHFYNRLQCISNPAEVARRVLYARSRKPRIREGQGTIFNEDLEMLERQQKNLLAHPERALLKLYIDAGGVQSRRLLERMIATEHEVTAIAS